MTVALAAIGWTTALGALVVLVTVLRRRAALVAQAAHELRGPLGAALLALPRAGASGQVARRIAAVELELRRAALALADLEAAPRGGLASECAESIDLGALVTEAVEAWRPLAGHYDVTLSCELPARRVLVLADRLRVTQAIANLILNAFEHGAGPVRVRVRADGRQARIEVRDQGVGVPCDRIPVAGGSTALAPGERLARAVRRAAAWWRGGLAHGQAGARRGQGLRIAARIADRQGGRLCSAPAEVGACVVLELPRLETAVGR